MLNQRRINSKSVDRGKSSLRTSKVKWLLQVGWCGGGGSEVRPRFLQHGVVELWYDKVRELSKTSIYTGPMRSDRQSIFKIAKGQNLKLIYYLLMLGKWIAPTERAVPVQAPHHNKVPDHDTCVIWRLRREHSTCQYYLIVTCAIVWNLLIDAHLYCNVFEN